MVLVAILITTRFCHSVYDGQVDTSWTSKRISIQCKTIIVHKRSIYGWSHYSKNGYVNVYVYNIGIICFYRMYSGRERKYDKYLLPLCIFLAIFSKGPIGIIIPVVSILTFLTIKGKIKDSGKYLGFRTWGILLLLCSVWFSLVWVEAGNSYLNDLLFNQTFNRAVSSFHHKEPFYYYFRYFGIPSLLGQFYSLPLSC